MNDNKSLSDIKYDCVLIWILDNFKIFQSNKD